MHLNFRALFSLIVASGVIMYTSLSAITPFDLQISRNTSSSVRNGINLYPVSGNTGTPVYTQTSGGWTSGVGKNFFVNYSAASNSLSFSLDGGSTVYTQAGFADGPANKLMVSIQTNSDASITSNTSLSLTQLALAYGVGNYVTVPLTITGQNAYTSFTFLPSMTGNWQLSGIMTMNWIGTAPVHNAAQFNIASLPLLSTPEPSTYLILGSFLALFLYTYRSHQKRSNCH